MWDLPAPGIESMSPALVAGFLTTGPPGKPSGSDFIIEEVMVVMVRMLVMTVMMMFGDGGDGGDGQDAGDGDGDHKAE